MTIIDANDAAAVHSRISRAFAAPDAHARAQELRRMFAELMDWHPIDGEIPLDGAPAAAKLPRAAHRIARLDGFSAAYIALDSPDTDRIRKAEAAAAAKIVADDMGNDVLLVFTNASASQLQFVHPLFDAAQPTLRRMSVDRDLPNRTAVGQIANIYSRYKSEGSLYHAISRAFDIKPLTDEFFAAYKSVFEFAESRIAGFADDPEDRAAKRLFAQTLFNRMMFVYFLQRKGWLSYGGDRDYLNALWRAHQASAAVPGYAKNFYADRLRLLFFAGLNNIASEDISGKGISGGRNIRELIGDVPFLNGGLFDISELDARAHTGQETRVIVPDDVVERMLDDLFNKFNFTVAESTPFDIEVAVDPEMLGKVFEELVTGRNLSGAFYTPRPVVSYMCREALKGYIASQCPDIPKDAADRFIDSRDATGVSIADAREIGRALDAVSVLDPACGSGAYLLGMMQELVELHTALYNAGRDPKHIYDLKLDIIRRNLCGADISDFAVNIAMLRLWLSLAIEYEGEKPPPLPNLDFKIAKGDSLLGPNPNPALQSDMFTDHIRESELGRLKADYMNESDGGEKAALKTRIAAAEAELKDALLGVSAPEDAVDWRVVFAETFVERHGFDIVIANPPYIQLRKDGGRLANLYKDADFATFARTGDIYQLFYERGTQLLAPGAGLLAYITSNSWLKAEYGKATRRHFAESHAPLTLIEMGKDVFDSAIVDSCIFIARAGNGGDAGGALPAVDMDKLRDKSFPPAADSYGSVIPRDDAPWSVMSAAERSAMDKINAVGTPLKDWDVTINVGVITGYNKAFLIDGETRQAIVDADPKSAEIIKPVLRGKDIQRYKAQWAGLWLITTFPAMQLDIDDYPGVKSHLLSFGKDRLEQSGKPLDGGGKSRKKTRHSWFESTDTIAYYENFAKEKLVWIELVETGRFAYDDTGIYPEATTFIMVGDHLKYLCAVLNSTIVRWHLQHIAPTSGMGTFRWKKAYVGRIPVPKATPAERSALSVLVDRILAAKGGGGAGAGAGADTAALEGEVAALEAEVDALVYRLYGLTDAEVAAVEGR